MQASYREVVVTAVVKLFEILNYHLYSRLHEYNRSRSYMHLCAY